MVTVVGGREAMLARKRREYRDYLPQFYDIPPAERTEDEANALRQVCGCCHGATPATLLCAAISNCATDLGATALKVAQHCAAGQHPGHP